MLEKGKKLYRSLSVKIILIISCAIVPINILTIYLSNSLISNFETRLKESYENELALYMTQVDEELHGIHRAMEEIMRDNWVELALGEKSKDTSMERVAFWNELQDARKSLDMVDAGYLRTNWEEMAYITADSSKCNIKERDTLQRYISKADFTSLKTGEVILWEIEGKPYLIKTYNCFTYSFGYIIDVETLLEPLVEVSSFESEKIFLLSNDNDLKEMIQSNHVVLTFPSKQMEYNLVRTFSRKEIYYAVPILERIIQVLGLVA